MSTDGTASITATRARISARGRTIVRAQGIVHLGPATAAGRAGAILYNFGATASALANQKPRDANLGRLIAFLAHQQNAEDVVPPPPVTDPDGEIIPFDFETLNALQ